MKRLLTGLFVLFTAATFGQNANEQARDAALAAAKFGSFEYAITPHEGINVNYSFTPAEPTKEVAIMLQTAATSPLSVKIKNSKGKVVKKWLPENQSDIYRETLNIQDLSAGSYSYEIYWDDQLAKTISFIKK